MDRRTVLAGIGGTLGALAGCADQTTDQATPTVVSPPPCPDRPEPLTEAAVERFVPAFERAYRTRLLLRRRNRVVPPIEFIGLRDAPEAEPTENGFTAQLTYRLAYRQLSDDPTPAEIHVDMPTVTVGYHVTERELRRTKTTGETTVDPLTNGTLVRCETHHSPSLVGFSLHQ